MRFSKLPLGGLVASGAAVNLYVSSYIGTITSLQLTQGANGLFSLQQVGVNDGSAPSPAWLTLNEDSRVVYALDEGLTVPNGSIATYKTSLSGELTQIDRHDTIWGPVSSVIYNEGKALAVAHYLGSSVSTFSLLASGGVAPLQNFTYVLTSPGTIPDRQDAPHPHETLIDPTGSFVVVPDLGADLIRIYSIDPLTSHLREAPSFQTPPGSGPRHGAFLKTEHGTYFFLVSELSNTVASYKVKYGIGRLTFEEIFVSSTYNTPAPTGAAAAEALITPDGNFLLTSSRNDNLLRIANFDPTNHTKIVSDTLQSWKIDHRTGKLEFVQLAPAGGRFPRQFSLNRKGNLAAVGLQSDSRVVIVERNVKRGTFGRFVASIEVEGQITAVIWDD